MNSKIPLLSLPYDDIKEVVSNIKELKTGSNNYRAAQICDWVYKKGVFDFSLMTNLSKEMRDILARYISLELPTIKKESLSKDGTKKILLALEDEALIEMVLIPEREKLTLCVSSQVGCTRRCSFCATAKMGFIRNLNVEEIMGQFAVAKQIAGERRITNLVFMGMGEPLDNYENVLKAIRILQDERLAAFSPRRITISTSGLAPQIIRLAGERLKIKLAVSLHSAIQSKREQMMSTAKHYPITTLKNALLTYQRTAPFRITIEYIMIKDFNVSKEDAKQLMVFVGDISSKINLIPYNECEAIPRVFPPNEMEIERFMSYLMPSTVTVTYRRSRGNDIAAACGQLFTEYNKNENKPNYKETNYGKNQRTNKKTSFSN